MKTMFDEICEIDEIADNLAKRRLDTLEFFLKLQAELSEIKPIVKAPWEIEEEKRKKLEKELLEQLQKNSYFENIHLKKELKNGIRKINRKNIKRRNGRDKLI